LFRTPIQATSMLHKDLFVTILILPGLNLIFQTHQKPTHFATFDCFCNSLHAAVLLQKVPIPRSVKKYTYPAFYLTQRTIFAFTTVRRFYLFSATTTQSKNVRPFPLLEHTFQYYTPTYD
jgi:hypothetical protein